MDLLGENWWQAIEGAWQEADSATFHDDPVIKPLLAFLHRFPDLVHLWQKWNLTYRERDGRPYLTGPELSQFRRRHKDRYHAAIRDRQPEIQLERTYVLSDCVPDMDACYLEPADAASSQP